MQALLPILIFSLRALVLLDEIILKQIRGILGKKDGGGFKRVGEKLHLPGADAVIQRVFMKE